MSRILPSSAWVTLLLGGALGFAVATLDFRPSANAAVETSTTKSVPSASGSVDLSVPVEAPAEVCCSKDLSRGDQLALAGHNELAMASLAQTGKKPNILIIWGDDIGWNNPSAYNRGMMGYSTPNIDRVANEGGLFTDWYGQQSCTAGRAAFITGQSPFRTGLLKVGLPGAKKGCPRRIQQFRNC